jgi:hypothetical protein
VPAIAAIVIAVLIARSANLRVRVSLKRVDPLLRIIPRARASRVKA